MATTADYGQPASPRTGATSLSEWAEAVHNRFEGLGSAATRNVPAANVDAGSGEVVLGSDSRLVDARTPTSHQHPVAQVTGLGSAATRNVPEQQGQNAADAQVVLGADTRLTNSRTPTAHAGSHAPGGSDPIAALVTLGNRLTPGQAQCTELATSAPGTTQTLLPGGGIEWVRATAGGWGYLVWGATSAAGPGSLPAPPPGTPLTVALRMQTDMARSYAFAIFHDAAGELVANVTVANFGAMPSPVDLSTTILVPARATRWLLRLQTDVAGTAQIHRVGWWPGAGGEWRPPGELIPRADVRVRSTGTTDWVAEVWVPVLGAWRTLAGNTGLRALPGGGFAQRVNDMVFWSVDTEPLAGFEPAFAGTVTRGVGRVSSWVTQARWPEVLPGQPAPR